MKIENINPLKKIRFATQAQQLFKIFTQGCIMKITSNTLLEKLDEKNISLSDISSYFPLSTIDLFAICNKRKKKLITEDIIIEKFMGKGHIKEAKEKILAPIFAITESNTNYKKRLDELGIDIKKDIYRAQFLIADIGFKGKVISIDSSKFICNIQISFGKDEIILKNVVIPQKIVIDVNDYIVTHLGYVGYKIDKKIEEVINNLSYFQQHQSDIVNSFKLITENTSTIDFYHFCSNCNLTKIQIENYHKRAS